MRYFICNKCGEVVKETEMDIIRGTSPEEEECGCGGWFVEAERCALCGEFFDKEILENGCCSGCIEEEVGLDGAFDFGDEDKQNIQINGFINWFLGKDLEKVLWSYLMADESIREELNKAARQYCTDDTYSFAGFLRRR